MWERLTKCIYLVSHTVNNLGFLAFDTLYKRQKFNQVSL